MYSASKVGQGCRYECIQKHDEITYVALEGWPNIDMREIKSPDKEP